MRGLIFIKSGGYSKPNACWTFQLSFLNLPWTVVYFSGTWFGNLFNKSECRSIIKPVTISPSGVWTLYSLCFLVDSKISSINKYTFSFLSLFIFIFNWSDFFSFLIRSSIVFLSSLFLLCNFDSEIFLILSKICLLNSYLIIVFLNTSASV